MTFPRLLSALGCVLLLAACGDPADGPEDGRGPYAPDELSDAGPGWAEPTYDNRGPGIGGSGAQSTNLGTTSSGSPDPGADPAAGTTLDPVSEPAPGPASTTTAPAPTAAPLPDPFATSSTPSDRTASPDNPPECPAEAPENPMGDCLGLPIYIQCKYGTYLCICDWSHWMCAG